MTKRKLFWWDTQILKKEVLVIPCCPYPPENAPLWIKVLSNPISCFVAMLNHFCYLLMGQLKLLSFLPSQQILVPLCKWDTGYLTLEKEYHEFGDWWFSNVNDRSPRFLTHLQLYLVKIHICIGKWGLIKCWIKHLNINLLSQSVRNSYPFTYMGAINFILKCTGTLFFLQMRSLLIGLGNGLQNVHLNSIPLGN